MKEAKELTACVPMAEEYPYYKAEVFSACLLESGFAPEQVVISRKDGLGRGFLYDIERVSVKYPYLYPDNPYLNIESGRAGIYDSLPEGLFYSPDHSGQDEDKTHIVDRIRANKRAELAVRRFLKLFEVEADSFLCDIRTKELKFDKRHTYQEFVSVFERHWGVIALMSTCEALRFLKVVPHIHSIRGGYEASAEAVSFILNVPVQIKSVDRLEKAETDCFPVLSEMRLDDNSVLCMEGESRETVALVILSGLSIETCPDYFRGKRKEKVLRYLTELLLETNTVVEIEIVPKEDCRDFFVGVSGRDTYLGINTYL